MNLYNAGLYTSNFGFGSTAFAKLTKNEQEQRKANKWYLESFHYIKKGRAVNSIRSEGIKIFLDSGAYSAFTLGESVDLGAYCDFIHANDDIIARDIDGTKMIAPLDVIGDAVASGKNLDEMERRGTQPLPCFHFKEPWEYLDYYCSKYKYIALGGLVRDDMYSLRTWFDDVFERTCNADGTPKIKFHAFGLTSLPLMMRYPWYSVDSSTWVQWAANGMILLPRHGKQLMLSDKSPTRKQAGQHLDSMTAIEREALEQELTTLGGDPKRLRSQYLSRWAWNCWAFPYYAKDKKYEGDKFVPEVQRLF